MDSLPQWLRDIIDYNNEVADRETGRMRRFQMADGKTLREAKKKEEEQRFSALMRLLQDSAYAKLYQEAVRVVDDAQRATDRASSRLAAEREVARIRLLSLRDSAASLPDGRKVFLAADGRVFGEDGEDVSAQKELVSGELTSGPGWENFQRVRNELADIKRREQEIEAYQEKVLDPARLRLGDPDHPPTPEELKDIVERTQSKMTPDIRAEILASDWPAAAKTTAADVSAADQHVSPTDINTPDLFAQFRAASAVIGSETYASPTAAPLATTKSFTTKP